MLLRTVLRAPRRAIRLLELERRGAARDRPLWTGTVLYESFAGHGALDNPEALFRELLRDPEFVALRHVWSLDAASGREFRAEFAEHPRVRFVRPRSTAYSEALARCEYLITNATFPPEFRPRTGQTVINTWHGTPLKRMGYDMPDGAYEAANTLRNFLASDVLLSQNPHMTRMYRDAYRLDGLFEGRILELGYPRSDRQTLDDAQRADAVARLRAQGIELDGPERADRADGARRLVVVAPTWKGTSFSSPRDDAEQLLATTHDLQEALGARYQVVLKAHQAVHEVIARHPREAGGASTPLVSNDVPTNVLLGLADVLVTDYSSIFIDFLSTGRRIVFFTPDRDEYARDRGTYFADDELPGRVVRTVPDLAAAILASADKTAEWDARARRWRAEFTPHDDGAASRRVIDAVFRGKPPSSDAAAPPATTRRRSVLLYLGGMRSNGITTSALNLLARLDHEHLDVSVLLARPRTREQRANAARIDPRVRQFHRMGGLTGRVSTELLMRVLGRLRPAHREPRWERRLWEQEWERTLGGARFDAVIDFSGYSRFWAELVLHSPPARRLIWLHNDMVAEIDRPVAGRRRMRRSLPAVFSLFPRFDGLVSVSASLSAANAEGLAERFGIPREHFRAARNVIDADSVRHRLDASLDEVATIVDPDSEEVTHPDWPRRLRSDPAARWFVTIGRLSPEKNQTRLLDAFALVHRDHSDARLLLVGDGPLRAELERHAARIGLGTAIVFAGALANPLPVLRYAACFVLSSDYEGQPMVLLEAAVAGLPIVSVRFGSVDDALPPGRVHVVEQTVEALAEGMLDVLDARVPADGAFDADAYNASALREFGAAIESEADPSSESSSSTALSAREISASNAIAPRSSAATTTTPTATTINVGHMGPSSAGERPRRERG